MMCTRQYIIVLLCFTTTLRASAQIRNQGWWKNAVFYQIYPPSFMDGHKNDGIGDLKGIINKLDHFVDIGVKGIWLSPIYASPMKDGGYDISDFKEINEDYGTIEDLDELVKSAKALGLKVILDLVPNHTSSEHEWFQKSLNKKGKYTDYYIWADPIDDKNEKPPNNWLSVFGGPAWTYNEKRNQWYFHQFLSDQPDLNYRNPEVEIEMQQVIEYWLMKGIDGFRIDAVPHLFETSNITLNEPESNATDVTESEYAYLEHIYTKDQPETYDLIQKWRSILDDYAINRWEDEKVIMTEAYTTLNKTLKYYESGSHIPFNFKFITDANSNSNASDFKKIIDQWINGMPKDSTPNWVMGNHDRKRLATRYPNRADQMTMLAMTLPGVAITYYGEEIGMEDNDDISYEQTRDTQARNAGEKNYKKISRDPCRTPFQWNGNFSANAGFSNSTGEMWLPIRKENVEILNLEKQKNESDSHYYVYKKLTSLRNSMDVLKTGSHESSFKNDLLIVKRYNDHELITLIINFSTDEQIVILKGDTKRKLLKTEIKVASIGSGLKVDEKITSSTLIVPANAAVIIYTAYKPENNGVSKEHGDSLMIMILLSITIMALRS